jgi:hypothetical protein
MQDAQGAETEAAVNGRYFIGVLSGLALVVGGLVVGSALFPTGQGTPSSTAPATTELEAEPEAAPAPAAPAGGEAAPEPVPEPAPEPEPAPQTDAAADPAPEPTPQPEPAPAAADPAPEPTPQPEPAPAAADPAPEPTPQPEPAPAAEPAPATEPEAEDGAAAPADPAPEATAETAATPITEDSVSTAPVEAAPAPANELASADPTPAAEPEPQAETADASVAEAPVAPETAPEAPAEPALASDAASEAPAAAAVVDPVASLAPVALPQLDTDAVLAALGDAAVAPPPAEAAETEPAPAEAAETEPAPTEPAPDTQLAEAAPGVEGPAEPGNVLPEVAQAEPPEVQLAEAAPAVEGSAEPGNVLPEVAQADPPEVQPEPPAAGALPAPETAPMPAPADAGTETADLPGTAAPDMPGSRPDALPGTAAEATLPEPEVAALPEAGSEEPSGPTFKSTPSLADKTEGVIVGRLPKIGDAPEDAVPPDAARTEAADAAPADPRPIALYAASFENPEGKPEVAVVLIDDGAADLDRAALAALPFPVTFALDPLDAATPERAAIYRGGGKEVVMLATGIAEGAQASDIEVAFQSMEQGLPEAVAVMELAQPVFQHRRPLASLVVPVVGGQGRGLLTWDQGLNAADQVARREDIAAAVVFRDLTSAGADADAILRVLDRAVFKAGQDGGAVVAGVATPDTVAALLVWTVEGRAASVALAPLTAVLSVD